MVVMTDMTEAMGEGMAVAGDHQPDLSNLLVSFYHRPLLKCWLGKAVANSVWLEKQLSPLP